MEKAEAQIDKAEGCNYISPYLERTTRLEKPLAHLKDQERAQYVKAMFSRISRRYDLLNTVMTAGQHHRWRRLATDLATSGIEGPALDVATGTGDFVFELAQRPGISLATGLDFSREMLLQAKAKAQRKGVSGRVSFLTGDALALPFLDGTFASVTSGFGLRNIVDLRQAIKEMARVTKHGGRVAILEITPVQGKGPIARFFPLYFRYVTPWLGVLLAGNREAYTYLPESVEGFPSAQELAEIMKDGGLDNITFRKVGLGTVAIHVGEIAS